MEAIYMIWLREMKRFFRDRSQLLTATVRPVTWLLILGYGLSPSFRGPHGVNYAQFVLPGIILMAVLFTAIQSAITIIWDREFGFLKEMLVAPIPRSTLVLGKAISGTTLAIVEGTLVLALAPVVGVPLTAHAILASLGVMALVAFSLAALGITIASRLATFEGFGPIVNFVIMPLFFLSGAMFPLVGLPLWLIVLVRVNPLTYSVDLLRRSLLDIGQFVPWISLAVLAGFGLLMLTLAVWNFNRES